jgi:hypothetical protein
MYESQKRARKKYDLENTRQIRIKLNKKTDKDILDCLDSQENRQGYIKKLIRTDIQGCRFCKNVTIEHEEKYVELAYGDMYLGLTPWGYVLKVYYTHCINKGIVGNFLIEYCPGCGRNLKEYFEKNLKKI